MIPYLKKFFFCFIVLCCVENIYAISVQCCVGNTHAGDTQLVRTLQQKQGVEVQAGDELKVVLQTDYLFSLPSNTHLLDTTCNDTLYQIAQLINHYGNRSIRVSGYTDEVGSDAAKLHRSKEQADTIAAYLWAQGIPLKNIFVAGYGDTKPVASNQTAFGSAWNRRIEIETYPLNGCSACSR